MAERWLYAWGVGSVSFGGASLLVPLYVVGLGGSTVDLGVLFATATAIGAPGAIVFGRLANRVEHRRSLVVLSLAIVAAVLVAMPFLRTVTAIIVGNAVLWLAVASVGPVLTMVVVDDTPASDWGERIGVGGTRRHRSRSRRYRTDVGRHSRRRHGYRHSTRAASDWTHADEPATTSLPPVTDAELVETRTD